MTEEQIQHEREVEKWRSRTQKYENIGIVMILAIAILAGFFARESWQKMVEEKLQEGREQGVEFTKQQVIAEIQTTGRLRIPAQDESGNQFMMELVPQITQTQAAEPTATSKTEDN